MPIRPVTPPLWENTLDLTAATIPPGATLTQSQAGSGGGTVTNVTATAPIASSGGTAPNISLNNSAVTPGSYGDATHVAAVTVDAHGLVTAAGNTLITGVSPVAAALASANIWVGNASNVAAAVAVSGDATLANTGALTVANAAITNAKLANMAAHTLKANITGSAAAPVDSSLSAILDAEIGSTRGMLLRRGASAWQSLGLGTTGQALVSDGTDALWGTVGGGSGGGLVFVGSATVTGAAATTFSISGLDLNSAGRYFIFFTLANATTSAANISLYYNSDTTAGNYDTETAGFNGATVTAARTNDSVFFTINTTANGGATTFFGWVSKDVNGNPCMDMAGQRDSTTNVRGLLGWGRWRTSGTNVTGITASSSVANTIAIGSKMEVWRLPTT